eukprot:TRINITY_DN1779_c0_g1_i1.p1 TRINITY_DN1779_c0_g1~~TRINITY_DN1779_c0_g1_i1.p1  ORF type:complete len:1013 (+),score=139.46 TRINITY_DN1779_c0_g1_i1:120-3158(+)
MADPVAVSQALMGTLSATHQERVNAEAVLKQFQSVPGFAVVLIKLMTAAEVPVPVRQGASINFKLLIVKQWSKSLSEEDKTLVKENMIELLISVPQFIRVQLAVALRSMLEKEFPHNWASLVPKIQNYLVSQDLAIVHGSLTALYLLIKKYSHKPSEGGLREPLYNVVNATFATVLSIFQNAAQHNTIDAIEIQKLVSKIFWAATQAVLPPVFLQHGALDPWFAVMLELYSRKVPENAGEPQDESERINWVPWKLKKWIGHILNRFIARYSTPRKTDAPEIQQFAPYFVATYAPRLLEANMVQLGAVSSGQFRPHRIISIALSAIGESIRYATLYKMLKPHIPDLLRTVIVPLFYFTQKDQELWNDDPAEFLRQDSDIIEDWWDPRLTAINLVIDLIGLRGEIHLNTIALHCLSILQQYSQTDPAQRNVGAKDGALTILGNLCGKLTESEQYKSGLEPMIVTHAFPEFTSPYPFLRARACWIFGQFFDVYQNQETFIVGLRAVIQCMTDKELPVRVRAALSLRTLCQSTFSTQALREILPQLLEAILGMMREVESEDLLKTLEVIIEKYSDDISPYAVAISKRLCEMFLSLVDADEEDQNSAMAALECLVAIQTILDATSRVGDTWAIYSQMEPVVMPALLKVMDPDAMDFFDEGLKIINYLTFYGENISDLMWSLFPLLYRAFMNWATDWMDKLLIPFDNFISRATDRFLSHPEYLTMVLTMYEQLVGEKCISQNDAGYGARLVEVVLHSCKGNPVVESKLPGIIGLALKRYFNPDTSLNTLKVLLLEVISNSLYCNPLITLQILEQANCTLPLFENWFQLVASFTRLHDKKVSVLGLTSILMVPFGSLPPSVQAAQPHLVRLLLRFAYLALGQHKAEEAADAAGVEDPDSGKGGYGSEGSDEEGPVGDDHDVDLDAATLHRLAYEAAQEYSWVPGEDDDDDDLEDEALYTSAIDDIDEFLFFVQTFHAYSEQNAGPYQAVVNALTAEEKAQLQEIVVHAQTKAATQQQAQ